MDFSIQEATRQIQTILNNANARGYFFPEEQDFIDEFMQRGMAPGASDDLRRAVSQVAQSVAQLTGGADDLQAAAILSYLTPLEEGVPTLGGLTNRAGGAQQFARTFGFFPEQGAATTEALLSRGEQTGSTTKAGQSALSAAGQEANITGFGEPLQRAEEMIGQFANRAGGRNITPSLGALGAQGYGTFGQYKGFLEPGGESAALARQFLEQTQGAPQGTVAGAAFGDALTQLLSELAGLQINAEDLIESGLIG